MDIYNELEKLCETIENEIRTVNEKLEKANGEIHGDDISYIDRLTHAMKSIKTTMAMMDSEYSNDDGMMHNDYSRRYSGRRYSRDNYSTARGRNARRDSMGRYSRDDGMVEELRMLMQDAPDDQTRKEFQRFIQKIEQM